MTKVLALVAHDNMKRDLAEWVDWNSRNLSRHHLVCTGTTGKMVEKTLRDHREEDESADGIRELPDLKITLLDIPELFATLDSIAERWGDFDVSGTVPEPLSHDL